MANNQYVNKVVYGGQTLIDLTGDTVTAGTTLKGNTVHTASGERVVGTLDGYGCTLLFKKFYYLEIPDEVCEVVGTNLILR